MKKGYSLAVPYAAALLVPALLGVAIQLSWPTSQASPYILAVISVVIAAWLGGLWPGLLSFIFSLAIVGYIFLEPYRSFAVVNPEGLFRFGVTTVASGVICVAFELMHRARRRAEKNVEVLSLDVTERRKHEKEITRLSNMYAALSQLNQAIVWTPTQDALIDKICEVLVEFGGFKMAWIGFHDPGTNRLIGKGGFGDSNSYLTEINIYTDDRPEGNGPAGTAFREKRPYVCNDFFADPVTLPWRERAEGAGIKAAAAFPIRLNNEVVGVLAVHSGEKDFFQDKEVALLTEAATDVSFALDNFEREAERLKAAESLTRLGLIVNSTDDGVIGKTLDGIITSWNPGAERIFGYTADEAIGNPITIIFPEDRLDEEKDILARIKRGESVQQFETIRVRKDGTQIHVSVTLSPITDAQGKVTGVSKIARDITESKKAVEELHNSEERYRDLFENNPCSMWVYDLETLRFLAVNDAAQFFYGYSREEFLEMPITKIRPAEDVPKLLSYIEGMAEIIDGPRNWRHLKKDGSIIDVEITSHELNFAGRRARLVLANDITERKQAEQKLRQSRESYRDLVENAHDIIYSLDLGGNFTSLNKAGERITGYSPDEVLNMNFVHIVVPEHLDQAKKVMEDKLNGVDGTAYDIDIFAKDGSRISVEVNSKLVLHDGVPFGIQGIARDVTERKLLEEQFRQSQKLESIGQLAGGIAHDFNNMLTAINGYSDLVLRRLKNDDTTRQNVQEIKKAGERAAVLTNQLLAFSRRQILQPVLVQINDAIIDTSNMLKRVIGEDIELVTVLKPNIGSIKVDPGQLSQILMNLSVNARDAMPNGGELTIETANILVDSNYAHGHVGILPGPYIVLTVRDTGIGMTPDTQERMFEPFFTTKEVGKGTGLGLATVYGIVKQSGGGIFFSSEIDHGTTFEVFFPRVVEDPVEAEISEDVPVNLPLGTETILLVEDEELVRSLSRQVLESCGYNVIEACDGIEAVEVFEKLNVRIDLLITDVVMPRMGGRELVERIFETAPNLPVLFASGYTDDPIVRNGVFETNVNFIQKPFTITDVVRKVRDLLDQSKDS